MTSKRQRARQAGMVLGRLPPGPLNAITDVEGVRVGHRSLHSRDQRINTGVTAVLPNDDPYTHRVAAGSFILNGAGEVSGLLQVIEWGLIESPILLTNTLSVGGAAGAAVQWLVERHPQIGRTSDVPIPIVGECDDSFLNDIAGQHVRPAHVIEALNKAKTGPVREGSVGGGTGMLAFDFKAGIGTSSRVLPESHGSFTFGVLVQANLGRMEDLLVEGLPLGRRLVQNHGTYHRRRENYGSIIVVFATDAPLLLAQLNRLAKRCAIGIGRMGSLAAHGSGEIVVGFSTANTTPRTHQSLTGQLTYIHDRYIEPLYQAAIEATEEAILNSLFMAEPMVGFAGNAVPALPIEESVAAWKRAQTVL